MTDYKRPVFGIPCRYNWEKSFYELRENYADAIYAAGGIPVLIPLIARADYINGVVESLDAICLSGAANDVNPLRYGREPKPGCGPVVPRRDETDMLLLAAAELRRLPVLAICFGIQSLNVSRGGTLIQDIEREVKGALQHSQEGSSSRHSHTINITEDSQLARLAGSTQTTVNSHHHQSIDIVGRDLEPIAWAPDGVIEAVTDTRADRFVLGLQWHPEAGWEDDSLSKAIFHHVVSVAAERSASRRAGVAEDIEA